MKKFVFVILIFSIVLYLSYAYLVEELQYDGKNIENNYFSPYDGKNIENSFKNITIEYRKNYPFKDGKYSIFFINNNDEIVTILKKEEKLYKMDPNRSFEIFNEIFREFYFKNIEIEVDGNIIPINIVQNTNLLYMYNKELNFQNKSNEEKITIKDRLSTLKIIGINQNDFINVLITSDDNKNVFNKSVNVNNVPLPLSNGTYRYEIKYLTKDKNTQSNFVIDFKLNIKYNPTFEVVCTDYTIGNYVKVIAKDVEDFSMLRISSTISDNIEFYKKNDHYEALIPIGYGVKPGAHKISYEYGEIKKSIDLNVTERDFKIQYLSIDENVEQNTRSDEAYEEYYEYFLPIRKTSIKEDLTDGEFILPVLGRITTEFGERRYVNDIKTSYRHAGLDIATELGTPVKASNSGKVVFSRFLTLTGNSVVIDHGQGIFTVYFHLDSRALTLGQIVKKGDLVGKVGSTGFSTGSHLHFMISYFDSNLEPGYFIYGEPITKENYKTKMNN
jgi:murein DD-endopeptidase MepM/ murein hydrolase activator NlpD